MYYQEELTQAQIARHIHTSRSTVSRLLHEARQTGVVQISINYPWHRSWQLEQALCRHFSLREAIVLDVHGMPYNEMLEGLGVLAAGYLEGILFEGAILGISWGTALYSTVQALRGDRRLPITVVQMIGAIGTGDPRIDGPDLARLLASSFGGDYRYLHAPVLVDDPQVRQRLLQEPAIRETLSLAQRANIALVGLGTLVPELSSMLRAGYVDQEGLAQLRACGVVGDICGRQCDILGHPLDIEMNRRVVGIELKVLHEIDCVIAIAGSEAKAEIILSALRGKHVNVLVTDESAARQVLALATPVRGSTGNGKR
jgi:DNA-binding transcriptional regulator LsrR (DeoR family)